MVKVKNLTIDELIKELVDLRNAGATRVTYTGTLLVDLGNTIVLTTEQQF
jgi:predicted HAD superfamily phosphohydrolase YqeG